ncbi:bifunctional ADP-dependent NAD(P)H-hydrate dehydratase/NAD(P)H-hydrate epimerase [Stenotrophomonas maltophilia]|uniref:bifunctional ADP-dependent NAD(P)H-hydrate dehydratase/NAD(P)H-hydrate epimerase n=1 Tax=Stenotrophomonas TaxID=40323 RepID=UPI0006C031A5|nr:MULTISPECIES: bifunctional ADP-dependent NAD(P)H-hydrate dehydratase/NAD(P)H-hydrate epimerase [Stenotrophomonas]KAA3600245.1 bifunctional ADP-dependent NAD(P)H-hydrate dehydratase/NAD(P)H-hydrate epimerase [Stenotrophomonas maltophilia]KOO79663.1 carbohydrate kinase [Stenotrophomonas maltophilia]MBN5126643.1 bifunctional ADP-dependent NAD(P)H-hydrate dehydratase/NAD(P)H-hydrate epimerase [Stenotrophomonas maltophilia]MBN5175262.1 bifunctional ADP-dependent NAD(P)H-hydrate dehydratase/NAD(P)
MANLADLFDSAAARALDAQASALAAEGGWDLMSQAGQAAWQCLLQHWPQAQRIGVVVGAGNNGGDGLVLARHALQAGREVRVVAMPGRPPSTALAQRAASDFSAAGGSVIDFDGALPQADIWVDALFGLGFDRAPEGSAQALIVALTTQAAPVLALDVPSGVDADRGAVPGVAVRAALTLQFIVAHRGLYTGDALDHCGQKHLAPLQVPAAAWQGVAPAAEHWTQARLPALLPPRRANTHKGESGHVLCVGGNHGSGGAIAMAAEAALRAGAGLLSLGTRRDHVGPLLARLPEAMTHALEDSDALPALLDKAKVVAIGPGLGQDEWARALFARVLASPRPLVLDADALNLLAQDPRALPAAILTPHPGEAARLLGCSTADVQSDRYTAAQALVERFHAVVVLKGAGSIVAAPGQRPRLIAAGNPGMAVGGMGDLLTGIIASLRAQGLPAFDAAAAGALLHALAGDRAAADGARGLLPTDLLAPLRRLANPELSP